jgi:high affinity Mn2+ porin
VRLVRSIGAVGLALAVAALISAALPAARAQESGSQESGGIAGIAQSLSQQRDALEADGWLVHGQFTFIEQFHPGFRSPYQGSDSLTPGASGRETMTFGPVFGRQLWDGAEFYINPEWDQGEGLNSSTGSAGVPNNEAFRVGKTDPILTIPRLFVRQVIGLGGPQEQLDADTLQFAELVDVERITLTAGKISVWDLFDDNKYAHDARTQFLNWALVGNGAVDYAADARGFTNGVAAEYNNAGWALRSGIFQVSKFVNGKTLDTEINNGWQALTELEERFKLFDRPGKLRELAMVDRTNAITYQASYGDLGPVNAADPLPGFRHYRPSFGFGLNLEQELTDDLGMFMRASWNPGQVQEFMFTEIDHNVSGGLSLTGTRWGRPSDTIGLAGMVNGLSDHHREFLEAGNTGFIVGDGALNYATEQVLETYYDWSLFKGASVALDYQFIDNPGYNADRGPVSIFALRLHAEF